MIRLHNPFESKNLTCFPKVFWNNSSLINSSPFKEKLRVFFLLWFVSRFLNLIFNLIYNFKGYNPIMVIRKYWLYSPCYTIYLWAYPTANSLYLPSPHSFTAPPPHWISVILFGYSHYRILLYFLDSTEMQRFSCDSPESFARTW